MSDKVFWDIIAKEAALSPTITNKAASSKPNVQQIKREDKALGEFEKAMQEAVKGLSDEEAAKFEKMFAYVKKEKGIEEQQQKLDTILAQKGFYDPFLSSKAKEIKIGLSVVEKINNNTNLTPSEKGTLIHELITKQIEDMGGKEGFLLEKYVKPKTPEVYTDPKVSQFIDDLFVQSGGVEVTKIGPSFAVEFKEDKLEEFCKADFQKLEEKFMDGKLPPGLKYKKVGQVHDETMWEVYDETGKSKPPKEEVIIKKGRKLIL